MNNFLYARDKMYLIDSNMRVYETGIVGKSSLGSYIFNGEYLPVDFEKKFLHKYGVFDCYLENGKDVCNLPLMSNDASVVTRLNKMNNYFPVTKDIETDKFGIFVKKFYIDQPEKNIFQHSNELWANYKGKIPNSILKRNYYLDGMIYTPAELPVAYNPTIHSYDLKQSVTWKKNLKWKPTEDNTIDFLIKFDKIEIAQKGNRIITKNKIIKKSGVKQGEVFYEEFLSAKLYNGGNSNINTNPCFGTNNPKSRILRPILFEPSQPSIENIYTILIPVKRSFFSKKEEIFSEDNEPIDDDTIVEVSYTNFDINDVDNYKSDSSLRWNILRTRHDKTFQYKKGLKRQHKAKQKLDKCLSIITKNKEDLGSWELRLLDQSIMLISWINEIKTYLRSNRDRGIEIDSYKVFSKFRKAIQDNFKVHSDFKTNINFGNNVMVAHNIWRTIHNPVTTEMICS